MKLALAGLFLALAIAFIGVYRMTDNVAAAIIGGALALASIGCSAPILQAYKGEKRQ